MRLSKTHQGQHFAQGAKRQARYRGCDILMRRRDLYWMVTIKPSHPELPVFQRHPFRTLWTETSPSHASRWQERSTLIGVDLEGRCASRFRTFLFKELNHV